MKKNGGNREWRNDWKSEICQNLLEEKGMKPMGPSGAGKTTLLNLLSTLDTPTQGEIFLDGQEITKMKNKQLSILRRDKIGFIFQDYNLLDTMTLQDNIALPLSLKGVASSTCIQKTKELAAMFGLEEHLKNQCLRSHCLE